MGTGFTVPAPELTANVALPRYPICKTWSWHQADSTAPTPQATQLATNPPQLTLT